MKRFRHVKIRKRACVWALTCMGEDGLLRASTILNPDAVTFNLVVNGLEELAWQILAVVNPAVVADELLC